jgi:methylglutaconyl-CoA hydratase
VPGPVARRLLYTGEIISGRQAADCGLVSLAAPAAELESTVDALVARLARHAPDALRRMKRLHATALTTEPRTAIEAEREVLLAHLDGPVAAEGLAAFSERRSPDFTAPAMNTQKGTA